MNKQFEQIEISPYIYLLHQTSIESVEFRVLSF